MANPALTGFRTQELAKLLKLSPRTLARWRAEGSGPPYCRLGRDAFYPESSVLEWLDRRQVLNRADELIRLESEGSF